MTSIEKTFLASAHQRLSYYKDLGDKALAVLEEKDLYYQPNMASNTIAVIIQHLSGNMLSRWTDFLTSDGEKPWRQRDAEFENSMADKQALIAQWQQGWACCLDSIASLQETDLLKTIYIRHEPLTVMDAINRQLAHYPYHVGQLIYIARMIRNDQWQSLSIPKNQSQQFNEAMQKPH